MHVTEGLPSPSPRQRQSGMRAARRGEILANQSPNTFFTRTLIGRPQIKGWPTWPTNRTNTSVARIAPPRPFPTPFQRCRTNTESSSPTIRSQAPKKSPPHPNHTTNIIQYVLSLFVHYHKIYFKECHSRYAKVRLITVPVFCSRRERCQGGPRLLRVSIT